MRLPTLFTIAAAYFLFPFTLSSPTPSSASTSLPAVQDSQSPPSSLIPRVPTPTSPPASPPPGREIFVHRTTELIWHVMRGASTNSIQLISLLHSALVECTEHDAATPLPELWHLFNRELVCVFYHTGPVTYGQVTLEVLNLLGEIGDVGQEMPNFAGNIYDLEGRMVGNFRFF